MLRCCYAIAADAAPMLPSPMPPLRRHVRYYCAAVIDTLMPFSLADFRLRCHAADAAAYAVFTHMFDAATRLPSVTPLCPRYATRAMMSRCCCYAER